MPRGDRTGPQGMGPRTGRVAGYCAGFGVPGYENNSLQRGFGRGFGRGQGFGRGRGWRHRFYASGRPGWMEYHEDIVPCQNLTTFAEKEVLKNRADMLQTELDNIRTRLGQISTEPMEK